MTIERWTHNWEPYPSKVNCWEHVPGKPVCMVRTKPLAKGYLWQCGKQYGVEPTLEQAKNWAETAREIWPKRLPK